MIGTANMFSGHGGEASINNLHSHGGSLPTGWNELILSAYYVLLRRSAGGITAAESRKNILNVNQVVSSP